MQFSRERLAASPVFVSQKETPGTSASRAKSCLETLKFSVAAELRIRYTSGQVRDDPILRVYRDFLRIEG